MLDVFLTMFMMGLGIAVGVAMLLAVMGIFLYLAQRFIP